MFGQVGKALLLSGSVGRVTEPAGVDHHRIVITVAPAAHARNHAADIDTHLADVGVKFVDKISSGLI